MKNIKGRTLGALIMLLTLILSLNFPALADNTAEPEGINQMMIIGMVDISLFLNNSEGNMEFLKDNDTYKNIKLSGRTAFFLKGKIKGKYLLTAKLDTGQIEAADFWKEIFVQNTGDSISRIDPEKYYPIYGDSSTSKNLAGKQGNLYVDLAWDNKELLWGNYTYNSFDNQLLRYNRSLYGLRFSAKYNSGVVEDEKNRDGNDLTVFWSKPESLHTYNELELTGGMLYYLKQGNLLVGTERLKIEVRDSLTGEVEETQELSAGVDYKVDYLSGRVILINTPSLLKDYMKDEDKSVYLIAEYEYDPINNINGKSSYGADISHNFSYGNGNALISGTYIAETKSDSSSYTSKGLAYNYNNEVSDFRLEWASSSSRLDGQYSSEDGGMTYTLIDKAYEMGDGAETNNDSAYLLLYDTNLKDINSKLPGLDISLSYKHKDKGFSNQQGSIEENTDSYNIELKGGNDRYTYSGRYFDERKEESGQNKTLEVKVEREVNEKLELSGNITHKTTINKGAGINENDSKSRQLDTELGFTYQLDENKKIYGSQELSLKGEKVSKTTLGAGIKPAENITIDAALTMDNSAANTGDSLKLGGSYQYRYGKVYSNITAKESGDTSLVLGGDTDINDRTTLDIEHKVSKGESEDSDSNVLGVNYNLSDKWSLALDYSRSNVVKADSTEISRDIIAPAVVYRDNNKSYKAKMEYRNERGGENLKQYVLTSGLSMSYNEELSAMFNLDYSKTERDGAVDDDSFAEAQFGLSYRPVNNDRLNLLAMYTYQEDYKPEGQDNNPEYNERNNILSIDAIYDIDTRWQLGEKLAWKNSQLIGNNSGSAIKNLSSGDLSPESDTYLWVNRLSYRAAEDWDVYGEYRVLMNRQAEDRKDGLLLGVNKRLGDNLKLGVGYNFTEFNDDLTNLDYKHRGLFVNLVKTW